MITVDKRLDIIKTWLNNELKIDYNDISIASADASFRRYFRVHCDDHTYIVMDAPPEKEPIADFIKIAEALTAVGVHAPTIKQKNISLGLLLLEDLGNTTYLDQLVKEPNKLYAEAIEALIQIQKGQTQTTLDIPYYDRDKLVQEMDLFETWFIKKHLNLEMTEQMQSSWLDCKNILIEACSEQPQTWVHRDFHSRNLMVTQTHSPGVIDFQDMIVGPIAYDLASIFKDCYIEWPRHQQLIWLEEYRLKAQQNSISLNSDKLITWFDLTGLQRHLKVLGIFCRLNYRDGKNQYMNDLPLVAKYVIEVLNLYPQFNSFKTHFVKAISSVS